MRWWVGVMALALLAACGGSSSAESPTPTGASRSTGTSATGSPTATAAASATITSTPELGASPDAGAESSPTQPPASQQLLPTATTSGGSGPPAATATPVPSTQPPPTSNPMSATVLLRDNGSFRFVPNRPLIAPGGVVTFVWDGSQEAYHDVTSANPPFEHHAGGGEVDSISVAYPSPGNYPFRCIVHPTMTGTVEVR